MGKNQKISRRFSNLPVLGSLASAILASLCCLGPVVLAVLGAGSAGFFSMFEGARPYLIGVTAVFLGLAFYLTYRKRKVECENGTCRIDRAPRWNKIILWAATILIVLFVSFPFLLGLLSADSGSNQIIGETSEVTLAVEGMTCTVCEFNIEKAIRKLDGIIEVKADHQKGEVFIRYKEESLNWEEIVKTIDDAGYKAIMPSK